MSNAVARFRALLTMRERVRAAILAAFEPVDDPAFAVRRLDVVQVALRASGRKVASPKFQTMIREVVEGLGAEAVAPHNRRVFRKLRPRGMSEAEARALGRAQRIEGAKRAC